jgi:hypothetical protein
MDTLHTVLRSIRGETKSRREHLSVFREFLDHLGRIGRNRTTPGTHAPRGKTNGHSKSSAAGNGRRNGKG